MPEADESLLTRDDIRDHKSEKRHESHSVVTPPSPNKEDESKDKNSKNDGLIAVHRL